MCVNEYTELDRYTDINKYAVTHTQIVIEWECLSVCLCGVIIKVMNCRLEVSEFEFQSRYYIHFRTNTLWKGMNPFTPPPIYMLNSTITVLLQGWLRHQITHEDWYAIKRRNQRYEYTEIDG